MTAVALISQLDIHRSPWQARLPTTVFLLLAFAMSAAPARSADANATTSRVIELFTSHGCSSCPSADAYLGELLQEDPGLVALEFHVDYWNSLVHGSAGNFVDPFSDAAWSERQRRYSARPLAGRTGVYTPQVIIDGGYATVGSDRRRIDRALAIAPPPAPLIVIERDGDTLRIRVDRVRVGERSTRAAGEQPVPVPDIGEVALVRYLDTTRTAITGGENKGLDIVNHRVVTSLESLGRVDAAGGLLAVVAAPGAGNEGCAVIVRQGDELAVLAGRLCPGAA